MKPLITILLAIIAIAGKAQTKDTAKFNICDTCTTSAMAVVTAKGYNSPLSIFEESNKVDTISVIAYCIDTETLKTKWRRLYAIYGFNKPYVNFNGLLIYKEYLMPDRKTASIYKVVYSITK